MVRYTFVNLDIFSGPMPHHLMTDCEAPADSSALARAILKARALEGKIGS